MASTKYKGTGSIALDDYHTVVFKGETKAGKAVKITLNNALNMGDIDWAFAEKGETVAQIVFTGCYTNTDAMSASTDEPWTIEFETTTSASGNIMLGAGVVEVDGTPVALSRGGSQFNTGRAYRDINADGDRGSVKDRVVIDEGRPTMTLNALTILGTFADLYSAVAVTQ